MNVAEALAWGVARLAATPRPALAPATPRLDAELLLAEALGASRAQLVARAEQRVTDAQFATFRNHVERRAAGEPVAYVLGRREFWTLTLEVGPDVLVPRPDTELLVELALERLRDVATPRIADLGTGSGAIGLALAAERPDARVVLVDASDAAIAVAERNRARLGLANAATRTGSWYTPLLGERFDVIVSNPPYLAADDAHLESPELAREPRGALVAGATGLEDVAHIAAGAVGHLAPGGWLIVEHGAMQGAAVRALFERAGLTDVDTARDLAGLERATLGRVVGTRAAP
jgi:release factor glutamine methyltransferase